MQYKKLLFKSVSALFLISAVTHLNANQLISSNSTDSIISDIKFLGDSCNESATVKYDPVSGNTLISFENLVTTIGPEKLQDRAICVIKYVLLVPQQQRAIIPAITVTGATESTEASKHSVSLRYRQAGGVGEASIWQFSGLAKGNVALTKPMSNKINSCGQSLNLKVSITVDTEFLNRLSVPTEYQSTVIRSLVLPKVELQDCLAE
ncbi:hypothetical protein H0A36_10320 [Endozoicomonas sp. SM1973]|uniref:DUF4360 domain-containing protein n=1 Tax=Spartinivicinus marinus TaxID=2994442 RepID=A0A853IFV4_9GAMM|nr:hypothetical protein [Spartinivicinus marinus]MCX4027422.1 hypothetical protein [Spartinivicinus marinus]NYZ66406.1 hypothetical protein [Spartinivicinus marinus]